MTRNVFGLLVEEVDNSFTVYTCHTSNDSKVFPFNSQFKVIEKNLDFDSVSVFVDAFNRCVCDYFKEC